MAEYLLYRFFNAGNATRLERLLREEDVALPFGPNESNARKAQAINRYFESIGYTPNRVYRTRRRLSLSYDSSQMYSVARWYLLLSL